MPRTCAVVYCKYILTVAQWLAGNFKVICCEPYLDAEGEASTYQEAALVEDEQQGLGGVVSGAGRGLERGGGAGGLEEGTST